jgi:hypothetical protein
MNFTQNTDETKASQEIKLNPTKPKIPIPIKLLAILYTTEGTEESKKNTVMK